MDGAWIPLLFATLRLATPLCIAAMGELLAERSGVLNIGIEGMMLAGAFAAFVVGVESGSVLLALGAAVLVGLLLAALFGGFVLGRGADPIVTGAALNLLALGGTGTAYRLLFPPGRAIGVAPAVGDLLPGLNLFLVLAVGLVLGVGVLLYRTRVGLAIRASGERAEAAHSQAIPVLRLRWISTLAGGACAGLAGASLVLWISNSFVEGMTAGRGFIALALVLFGGYHPVRIVGGALLFGAASAFQFRLQAEGVEIVHSLLLMTPYLLTLAVLAVYAGRGNAPADLGRPFVTRE